MSEFNPQQLAQYDTLPSMAQGYSLARGISNDIRTRNETDQSKAAVESLINDPSPKNILAVTLRHPQLGDGVKSAFENMDIEERKRRVAMASPVYSSLLSGRIDIAKKLLSQQAAAMEASGGDPDEIARIKARIEQADNDPDTLLIEIGTALAYGMGEKNFASTFATFESARNERKMLPFKQDESIAKTEKDKASTELDLARAPYAADMAAAQLESEKLKPWDTRADNATNAAQVKAALELNKINKDNLLFTQDEKKKEREAAKIEKESAYQVGQSELSLTLSKIDDALAHPSLKSTPFWRAATEIIPGSESKDFKKIIETIDARNFVTQYAALKAQGLSLGSLSNAEGDRFAAMIGRLDPSASNKYNAAILSKMRKIVTDSEDRSAKKQESIRKVYGMETPIKKEPHPITLDPEWLKFKAEKGMIKQGHKLQINMRTGELREVPVQ